MLVGGGGGFSIYAHGVPISTLVYIELKRTIHKDVDTSNWAQEHLCEQSKHSYKIYKLVEGWRGRTHLVIHFKSLQTQKL